MTPEMQMKFNFKIMYYNTYIFTKEDHMNTGMHKRTLAKHNRPSIKPFTDTNSSH